MKKYWDKFDFGMEKFRFKDLFSNMKSRMDNMLFKKDKFNLGMDKFKLNEPLLGMKHRIDDIPFMKNKFDLGMNKVKFDEPSLNLKYSMDDTLFKKDKFDLRREKFSFNDPMRDMKHRMDDTLFKKDKLDLGMEKFKFNEPLLDTKRRMDDTRFGDKFKIDYPHPNILKNLERPITKPDLRDFNRSVFSNPASRPTFDVKFDPDTKFIDMRSFDASSRARGMEVKRGFPEPDPNFPNCDNRFDPPGHIRSPINDLIRPNSFNRPVDTRALDSFFEANARQTKLELSRKF